MEIIKLGFVSEFSDESIKSLFSDASSLFDLQIHNYTGDVCHYFPAAALQNILSPQSIIFSDTEFLNDLEEDNNLFLILDELLNGDLTDEAMELMLIDHLKGIKTLRPKMFSGIVYSDDNVAYNVKDNSSSFIYNERQYVFCTSKDDDSLAMWKYYAKGGHYDAYNILFSSEAFLNCIQEKLSHVEQGIKIMHGSVIYDDNIKKEILLQLVRKINAIYKEHLGDSSSDSAIRQELVNRFYYLIKEYSIFFKNEAYRHEEEYRFVIKIDNANIKKYNLEYGFRNAGSYLIPFLKIKFPKEMIKVLVANPTIATDSLAIKSLAAFIDYYEYTETAIGVSTVPLRY